MEWNERKNALILCAHADDELGCAGAIIRMVEAGYDVRYLALSYCAESVPPPFPPNALIEECRACTEELGISSDKVEILNFPVRHFPVYRQEILQQLIDRRNKFSPDVVFLPSSFDTHQDHQVVYQEGFRAYKFSTILGYELPQNTISFQSSVFISLSAASLSRKIKALNLYRSQQSRIYTSREFIESLAKVRGMQCNTEFAESFELVRMIIM